MHYTLQKLYIEAESAMIGKKHLREAGTTADLLVKADALGYHSASSPLVPLSHRLSETIQPGFSEQVSVLPVYKFSQEKKATNGSSLYSKETV